MSNLTSPAPWHFLVRRELWERPWLWRVPALLAVLLLGLALAATFKLTHLDLGQMHFGAVDVSTPDAQVHMDANGLNVQAQNEDGKHESVTFDWEGEGPQPLRILVMGVGALLLGFSSITLSTYLLDCLYAERRDRSILFWRSLPVSDLQAVLAKYAVVWVVPVAVYVLAVVVAAVISLLLGFTPQAASQMPAAPVAQFASAVLELGQLLVINLLWYAPLFAALQLASLAPRAPVLWALFVPLGLIFGEWQLFGSHHLRDLLGHRFEPLPDMQALAAPGLWLGLLVAAGLLAVAVRLRRYSDDS